jgi:hypothetical protein
MKVNFIYLFFILSLIFKQFQLTIAQNVNQVFDAVLISDNFDTLTASTIWPNVNNADNLFLIDKGNYFLYRRSISSAYVILPRWSNELSSFYIKTSLKLAPSESNEQTIGILFMGQSDGKSAIIFEINKSKQYRVKQFIGDNLKYLSGDKENLGWVKNSVIKSADEFNIFEVKVANGMYDLSINNNYLMSLSIAEYKYGGMGIVIGPATKAKCDYFYVYSNSSLLEQKHLADTNTKLMAQISLLTEENYKLKNALELKNDIIKANEILEKQIEEIRSENTLLQSQNKALMDTLVKLSVANNEMMQQLKENKTKSNSKTYGKAAEPVSEPAKSPEKASTQKTESIPESIKVTVIASNEANISGAVKPIPVKVKKAIKKF